MNIFISFVTLSVFLNLFKYYAYYSAVPTYIFQIFIFFIVTIYYLVKNKQIMYSKLLFLWIIYFFIISTIYYVITGFGGLVEYKRYVPIVTLVVIFFNFSLMYALDDDDLSKTRRIIFFSMLIAVILLVYDFVFPGSFVIDNKDVFISGRALATYNNQNIVGAVLILGLILSIDILDRKYRMYYIMYIFIGIAVTFSRSNLIIFFIILFIFAIQKKISRVSLLNLYIVLFGILLWLGFGGLEWIGDQFNIEISSDLLNRVNFFIDRKDADTSDMNERKMVLHAALNMFQDHPIFGNGFASTSSELWAYRVGPHNTFARTWAEYGLFGVLIIPLFLLSATYQIFFSIDKAKRDLGILFIVYYTLSSFFSHNMLEQDFNIIGAIVIATLGYKNYRKEIYEK